MKVEDLKIKLTSAIKEESIYTSMDVNEWICDNADGVKLVAEGLFPSNHRYFQSAMDIYKCDDGYLGIRSIREVFDENTAAFECDYGITMHPMYECMKHSFTAVIDDSVNDLKKVKFADSLFKNDEIKECLESRHVDSESLEESCMVCSYVANALLDAGLIDGID